MATRSSSSKLLGALIILALAAAALQPSSTTTTTDLTLHNLCPYPVWPLVTPNAGIPSIPTDADGEPAGRLDVNGEGLTTLSFPPGAWSGRVVVRTGCDVATDADDGDNDSLLLPTVRCATGDTPPVTVAQVCVGGAGGGAAYSVSLVDGFNVPVVVTPHGMPPEVAVAGRWDCRTRLQQGHVLGLQVVAAAASSTIVDLIPGRFPMCNTKRRTVGMCFGCTP